MGLNIPDDYVQGSLPIVYGSGALYGYITMGMYDFDNDLSPLETLDTWVQAFIDNVAPRIDGGCTIGPAIGTLQSAGGDYFTFPGVVSGVGGREDETSAPPAVSALVTKVTGRPGRTGKGRCYLPWVFAQDEVEEDGSIDAGLASTIAGLFVDMAGDMTTNGVAPMLLHNTGVPLGDDPTPIVNFTVATTVATQRRRQRR